ncbi:MAG: hypothetical protein ABUL60_34190 [Myxococcales bacterium]
MFARSAPQGGHVGSWRIVTASAVAGAHQPIAATMRVVNSSPMAFCAAGCGTISAVATEREREHT